ncbi:hypothetical protein BKA57DRAFT_8670 [Linnemannia elongata]|nr:hypothetical protein BKA57DRAFT_8670 [Linnemannia elongata]
MCIPLQDMHWGSTSVREPHELLFFQCHLYCPHQKKKNYSLWHVSGSIFLTTPFHKHTKKLGNTHHPPHPFLSLPLYLSLCFSVCWSNDIGDYGGKNPCINTPLAQNNEPPCNFMQKTVVLTVHKEPFQPFFGPLVLLFACEKKREEKAKKVSTGRRTMMTTMLTTSQPKLTFHGKSSFWHEQTNINNNRRWCGQWLSRLNKNQRWTR